VLDSSQKRPIIAKKKKNSTRKKYTSDINDKEIMFNKNKTKINALRCAI
jgi:hypothetical protein